MEFTMKNINISLIACSVALYSSLSLADQPSTFIVNSETIRTQLLSKNITLLQTLNNVENSKLNVSMARAKLLPSLNLGALLPALANPSFLLSSVTFLFPFLVPSNWAVLKQQKELFEADKAAYKAVQLNVLGNALSLYHTYLTDQKIQNVYRDQSTALGTMFANLQKQSEILGNVSSDDLSMSAAQWEESKVKVSKLQELLVAEVAGVRTMLGLPLNTVITSEDSEIAASDYETRSAMEISDHSLKVAPEISQMGFLESAAKASKFAKIFGFISSASMSASNSSPNVVFGNLKAGGAFSFGADNIVNIKIASNNMEAIKLREEQLKEENERMSEVIAGQINEVKSQEELTAKALADRLSVYQSQQKEYAFGLISLQTLLQTQIQLTDSYVNQFKSELDLKMQRLTLGRLVIDGDFAKIQGCTATEQPDVHSGGIFHKKKDLTLDQACNGN